MKTIIKVIDTRTYTVKGTPTFGKYGWELVNAKVYNKRKRVHGLEAKTIISKITPQEIES